MADRPMTLPVPGSGAVSGLLRLPGEARALYVLAHGAGAGMEHPFMKAVVDTLEERGVGTLRYQFPYMERGGFPPDRPTVATATVRAAVAAAREHATVFESRHGRSLPVFAGGKSFGARMTSTAAADHRLPGVRGLVFLGWPLHPANKPGTDRAAHLAEVTVPMLFIQGDRDRLADLVLLRSVIDGLDTATLHVVEGGDHGFGMLKRSGRTMPDVMAEIGDVVAAWLP